MQTTGKCAVPSCLSKVSRRVTGALIRSCRAGNARPPFPAAAVHSCSRPQQRLVSSRTASGSSGDPSPDVRMPTGTSQASEMTKGESTFWQHMSQLMQDRSAVPVSVRSANRGGLVVEVLSDPHPQCHGFMPFSRCSAGLAGDADAIKALIGTQLSVRVFELQEDQQRLLLRMPTQQEAKAAEQAERHRLSDEGYLAAAGAFECLHVYDAVVQSKRPYGLFMDLGQGLLGLLHISQISQERVEALDKNNDFQVGDAFKVMVLVKSEERRRMVMLMKKLEKTAGDMLRDRMLVSESAEEVAAAFREKVARGEESLPVEKKSRRQRKSDV